MVWKAKISKPKYPDMMIDRPRLYAQLDRWQELRAIMIHAPAGYGKSSLVSRWIDVSGLETCSAWLSLDESDCEPRLFAQHLAAALEYLIPGSQSIIQLILDDRQGDLGRVLERLFTAIQNRAESASSPDCRHILLVLDDLHRVQSTAVEDALMTLLTKGPQDLHLIMLARWRTALPLARLCANGEILPLEKEFLKFTEQEVSEYLRSQGYLHPDEKEVAQLTEYSEGWVVALKLAMLSNPSGGKLGDLIQTLHDKQSWLADYLMDEVLSQQKPELQRFLLLTSILDKFNVQLSEAVSGDQAAHARLDEITRLDLFLFSLNEPGDWFRYQHLFQELLQHRLRAVFEPSFIAGLHRQAGDWLAGAGRVEAAVVHFLAGQADGQALALVEEQLRGGLLQDYYQAKGLLAMLPEELLIQSPQLMLDRCRLAMLFNDERIEAYVREAEHTLKNKGSSDPESDKHQAEWLVLRAISLFIQGDSEGATEFIRLAQAQQSYLDGFHLGTLFFLQMHLYSQSGKLAEMDQISEAALTAFLSADFSPGVLAVRRELARRSMWAGRRQEANARFRELIDSLKHSKMLYGDEYAIAYLFAAENSYWQDHLAQALTFHKELQELSVRLGDPQLIQTAKHLGVFLGGDTCYPNTDVQAFINQLVAFYSPVIADLAVEYHTRSLIARGHCDLAWEIVKRIGIDSQSTLLEYRSYRRFIIKMNTCIARGVDLADITRPLSQAISTTKERKWCFEQLQLLALLAWQKIKMGDTSSATRILLKAVVLAGKTGYIRVILDIPDLVDLLQSLNIDLITLTSDSTQNTQPVKLTVREQRVMEMLASGYTYPQIAREMVISLNTVRTHVRKLYRKLGTNQRDQAIAKAMILGLLPVDSPFSETKL